jgi:tetratricopeptide (TPR) repeat protein
MPVQAREPAGTEIQARLQECDGADAPTLGEVMDGQMDLAGLHVALAGGAPKLSWYFVADTYCACSPDYQAHGQASSGLVPAAAPLGLDGPLPGGVTHALVHVGDVPTVGWAKLSLSAEARKAALAAFRRDPEAKWPPVYTTERPVGAGSEARHPEARTKLDEGRRLTRAGDYAAAIATFDAAIGLDGTLARAWSERGYAKLLAGDLAGARGDLDAALPLDEGAAFRAAVHYNLGQVAERSGDPAAAKRAYETSLALRDNETVRKALARLR